MFWPIPSITVESFYELPLVDKRKICRRIPVKWKIFHDEKKSKKDTTPGASTKADPKVEEEEDEDMTPKGNNSKGKLVT